MPKPKNQGLLTAASSADSSLTIAVATPDDWDACIAIRHEVFVVGQDCPPAEEFDTFDDASEHLIARIDGLPVGTARWRPVPFPAPSSGAPVAYAKLERFAVLESARGAGIGRRLVATSLDRARSAGHHRFLLHAQSHLEDFYAAFGFETRGGVFLEAGIPHVKMVAFDSAFASQPNFRSAAAPEASS